MRSSQAENINSRFFDGHYKEIWRSLIPDGLTKAEIDFLIDKGQLKPGDKVLDLMCGYGRHALALARNGIQVTAVDNLGAYVNEVREVSQRENLVVTCIEDDVIGYEPTGIFDLVICLGNNLSFFTREETEKLFSTIGSHTKQGGIFIANSWTIAEIVFKNFVTRTWSDVNGLRYLVDNKFFFNPTRIESEITMIPNNGAEEKKKTVDYIYSVNETENTMMKFGLSMREIRSIPGKKKFTLGEPRAYFVAKKHQ
ncbi:MAG: class I SAM-dependent methyltransferase [Bacteroidetes bacterium]|nr:MAG: class I SAM-dependent methyltransferase [Bacteroidota bacterium]